MTTDFAKGIKTNPYAPRTGHDDPSAQTRNPPRRGHIQHVFVLRVSLSTLNQPCLSRITRSRRKKGGVRWRARRYNGCPWRYTRNICMLGRFPVVLWDRSPEKSIRTTGSTRGSSLSTSLTKLRRTSVVGTITA